MNRMSALKSGRHKCSNRWRPKVWHLHGSDHDLAGRHALLLAAADPANQMRADDGVGAHLQAEQARRRAAKEKEHSGSEQRSQAPGYR